MSAYRIHFAAVSLGLLFGCAEAQTDTPVPEGGGATSGTGGTAGTSTAGTTSTGGTGTGGGSGSGGTSGGSGGASGGSGGASGGTGGAGTSGAGTGGTSGGGMGGTSGAGAGGMIDAGAGGVSAGGTAAIAGTAGTSGGGAGGTGGAAGTAGKGGSGGGTTGAATPSPGCSKGSQGTKISKTNEEIVDFPPSYDGAKPFPLLMMLHACGNPNNQWENLTNQRGPQALVNEYIRWMPNTTAASGQCWDNYNTNIARIKTQYDELLNNYCVDTSRIFGTGHSSGAQMLVNILAHQADAQYLKLKGVAPVSADPYNVAVPTPLLYMDGVNDTVRGPTSAPNTVAKFRTANMCSDASMPYSAVMGCKSNQNQANVDPGCIIYDGCSVPTVWCAHNDPDYSNTQHGVPCFATQAMYDFFKMLVP